MKQTIETLLDKLPKVIHKSGEVYPLWIHPTNNDKERNYWYVSYKLGCDQLYQTNGKILEMALQRMIDKLNETSLYFSP